MVRAQQPNLVAHPAAQQRSSPDPILTQALTPNLTPTLTLTLTRSLHPKVAVGSVRTDLSALQGSRTPPHPDRGGGERSPAAAGVEQPAGAARARAGRVGTAPAPAAPSRAQPAASAARPPLPACSPPAAAVVTWSRGRVARPHDALELTEAGMGGVRGVRGARSAGGAGGAGGVGGVGGVGDGHVVASAPARAPATSAAGEAPVSVEPTAPRRSPGAIFGGFMGRMTARGTEPTAEP